MTGSPGVLGSDWFQQETDVSRETLARLIQFEALLRATQGHTNLVSARDLDQIWPRHFLDSAQLLDVAAAAERSAPWADLGSGNGFPGLVLAILLSGEPGFHMHLIESTAKKCRFLAAVVEALDLPATVHHGRIETTPSLKVPVVTARGCAPLQVLLGWVRHHIQPGSAALLLKGESVEQELTQAARSWTFEVERFPSRTHPRAQILRVRNIEPLKG